jgi:hypothetical protein
MSDDNITEKEAADKFIASATYAELATESTGLWQKPWQETYDMFRKE